MASGVDGHDLSASRIGHLTPRERASVPRKFDGPIAGIDLMAKRISASAAK